MRLEPLLTFRNGLADTQVIGEGPFGARRTYVIGPGTFEGERLRGEILPGGGDWMTVGRDGLANLDVRKTLRTHDGALIHLSYQGLYRFDDAIAAKLEAGAEAEFGETLFQVQARFETGDPRYDWLNSTLAIGEGRETSRGVEYRLYSLV
ncbi:MAG: DUF3237 domain-containing protein [Alphaproteobacteria bacterium]|nr:MAG: DUF3237 domain-containing protein [Alphaproteobacteria bacterium]